MRNSTSRTREGSESAEVGGFFGAAQRAAARRDEAEPERRDRLAVGLRRRRLGEAQREADAARRRDRGRRCCRTATWSSRATRRSGSTTSCATCRSPASSGPRTSRATTRSPTTGSPGRASPTAAGTDSPRGNAWVTAYALWGLHQAKQHGQKIPDGVLDHAKASVRRYLHTDVGLVLNLPVRAFVLDVLATDRQRRRGLRDAPLRATREAAALRAGAPRARDDARRRCGARRRRSSSATSRLTCGSRRPARRSRRTSAIATRRCSTPTPARPRSCSARSSPSTRSTRSRPRLAKGLLAARRGGSLAHDAGERVGAPRARRLPASAQESRAAGLRRARVPRRDRGLRRPRSTAAASKSRAASFTAAKIFGSAGGAERSRSRSTGRARSSTRRASATRGRSCRRRRSIAASSCGRSCARVKPEALADALRIDRRERARRRERERPRARRPPRRDADPREHVVIDDPLPAGLEPVEARLATTARVARRRPSRGRRRRGRRRATASDDDERAAGRAFQQSWYHREFHDDRVLTFVDHMAAGMYHYRYLARATTLGTLRRPADARRVHVRAGDLRAHRRDDVRGEGAAMSGSRDSVGALVRAAVRIARRVARARGRARALRWSWRCAHAAARRAPAPRSRYRALGAASRSRRARSSARCAPTTARARAGCRSTRSATPPVRRRARGGGPPLLRAPRASIRLASRAPRRRRSGTGASSRARRRSRCSSRARSRPHPRDAPRQARRDGARAADRGSLSKRRDPRGST